MPPEICKPSKTRKPTLSDNVTPWTRPQPTRRPPPAPCALVSPLPAHLAPVPPCTPTAELVRLCGCSERTARRWKASGAMPAALAQWVGLHQDGGLGPVDAHWRGWMLRRGALISPEGWEFRPGSVAAAFADAVIRAARGRASGARIGQRKRCWNASPCRVGRIRVEPSQTPQPAPTASAARSPREK